MLINVPLTLSFKRREVFVEVIAVNRDTKLPVGLDGDVGDVEDEGATCPP